MKTHIINYNQIFTYYEQTINKKYDSIAFISNPFHDYNPCCSQSF